MSSCMCKSFENNFLIFYTVKASGQFNCSVSWVCQSINRVLAKLLTIPTDEIPEQPSQLWYLMRLSEIWGKMMPSSHALTIKLLKVLALRTTEMFEYWSKTRVLLCEWSIILQLHFPAHNLCFMGERSEAIIRMRKSRKITFRNWFVVNYSSFAWSSSHSNFVLLPRIHQC